MRKCLYRGQRVSNGEWIEGYPFFIWEKAYITWGMENKKISAIEVIPETISQFTSILDICKKEIFEDDIVVKNGFVYRIAWNNLHAAWGLFSALGQSSEDIVCDIYKPDGSVINCWMDRSIAKIGNIHENPELLK